MFTGLVEEVGMVEGLDRGPEGGQLRIGAHAVLDGTQVGDSIAVSGVCLTVVGISATSLAADLMAETLERTTLGELKPGRPVNLERALSVGGRLGGHLVLGHVDAVTDITAVQDRGASLEVRFSLPALVAAYVAPKGSIAIDGISLTVVRVGEGSFDIGVIPHTLEATTLKSVAAGMRVNVEVDVLARYVERALQGRDTGVPGEEAGAGLTEELLREEGFIL
jgi:riboflavin synthase